MASGSANTLSANHFDVLPVEIVNYIFSYLSYEDISLLRRVSRSFDSVARSILNSSFFRLGERLDKAMSTVKKMLPKRESQRRYHTLSRVNEVYSALETRYALLSMTFRKFIDDDACCFIAGKVLDEGFAVLRVLDECVKRREQPRETQELLRDIRDYSSMAMEYFEEHVAPTLRTRDPLSMLYRSRCRYSLGLSPNNPSSLINDNVRSLCSTTLPSTSNVVINPVTHCFGDLAKLNAWKKGLDEMVKKHERIIAEQDRVIREQSRAINGIIECLHQSNSNNSFNFLKELKAVEVHSSSSSAMNSKSVGKRKAMTSTSVIPKKKLGCDN